MKSKLERPFAIYYGWIVVTVAFAINLLLAGVQRSIGLFIPILQAEFLWDRATVSLAPAISFLVFAFSQPIVGKVVDKFGPTKVLILGGILVSLSQSLLYFTSNIFYLYLLLGLATGLAFGATVAIPLPVLVTSWFKARRGLATSISFAGISGGYLLLIPIIGMILSTAGWRITYLVMGGLAALIVPFVILFLRHPNSNSSSNQETVAEYVGTPLKKAIRIPAYWLLALPYFACGFSVTLIDVHFVPMLRDAGIPTYQAASIFGMMGFTIILGLIIAGFVADRSKRKIPLAMAYCIRGLSLVFLLSTNFEIVALYTFIFIFGFSVHFTIPPVTLMSRELFGAKSMGTIFGTFFMVHQLGSAVSSYAGGLVHDLTGSYVPLIQSTAVILLIASFATLLVREKRYYL